MTSRYEPCKLFSLRVLSPRGVRCMLEHFVSLYKQWALSMFVVGDVVGGGWAGIKYRGILAPLLFARSKGGVHRGHIYVDKENDLSNRTRKLRVIVIMCLGGLLCVVSDLPINTSVFYGLFSLNVPKFYKLQLHSLPQGRYYDDRLISPKRSVVSPSLVQKIP